MLISFKAVHRWNNESSIYSSPSGNSTAVKLVHFSKARLEIVHFWKAWLEIDLTGGAVFTIFKEVHWRNAISPIVLREQGRWMTPKEEHLTNAFSPISSIPSGKKMVVKLVHIWNAPKPIFRTPEKSTWVRCLQSANAWLSITLTPGAALTLRTFGWYRISPVYRCHPSSQQPTLCHCHN